MDSISSLASERSVRPVVEGAVIAVLGSWVAGQIWRYGGKQQAVALGVAAAWAASSVSVVWLMAAQKISARAFWRAFGGGMALRAAVLAALVAYGLITPRLPLPTLLLAYVFGTLVLSLMEFRHIK